MKKLLPSFSPSLLRENVQGYKGQLEFWGWLRFRSLCISWEYKRVKRRKKEKNERETKEREEETFLFLNLSFFSDFF